MKITFEKLEVVKCEKFVDGSYVSMIQFQKTPTGIGFFTLPVKLETGSVVSILVEIETISDSSVTT